MRSPQTAKNRNPHKIYHGASERRLGVASFHAVAKSSGESTLGDRCGILRTLLREQKVNKMQSKRATIVWTE